jgi:hypothetical protein
MRSPPNTGKTTRLLHEIEAEFPVDDWQIAGVHVWPIIRIRIFQLLHDENSDQTRGSKYASNFIASFKGRLKEPIKSFLKLLGIGYFVILIREAFATRTQALGIPRDSRILFFSPNGRRILYRNRPYHRTFGPFCDFLKRRGMQNIILELPGGEYDQSAYDNASLQIYKGPSPRNLQREKKRSFGYTISLPYYNEFLAFLLKTDLKIHQSHFSIPEIRNTLAYIRAGSNTFADTLRETQIQLCVIDCFYHWDAFSLIIACKMLKIKTLEIQHGVQGTTHPAYAPWLKMPKAGFAAIPEFFWCWDDYSAKNIQKWLPKNKNDTVIIGGNPLLSTYRQELQQTKFVHPLVQRATEIALAGKTNVLVTLQPGIKLTSWIIASIKAQNSPYYWWIRLHPKQNLEDIAYILNGPDSSTLVTYQVHSAAEIALPELISQMNLHLTYHSSCILEAEFFGVPSLTYGKECLTMYPRQVENKNLVFVNTEKQLLRQFQDLKQKKQIGIINDCADSMKTFANFIQTNTLLDTRGF